MLEVLRTIPLIRITKLLFKKKGVYAKSLILLNLCILLRYNHDFSFTFVYLGVDRVSKLW